MLLRSCWLSMRVLRSSGRAFLRVLPHLLGQRLHELVEGCAQLIGELLDLVVAGVAVERFAQRILRLAQAFLGLGDIAILKLNRHRPHPRHDLAQLVVGSGAVEAVIDRAQAEIDPGLRRELFWGDGERFERGQHDRLLLGIKCENAALFDERARQRLAEAALRQLDVGRLAAAHIAGLVMRNERHLHFGTRPGMLGEIVRGLRLARAGARLRQRQGEIGRLKQRMRRLLVVRAQACGRMSPPPR